MPNLLQKSRLSGAFWGFLCTLGLLCCLSGYLLIDSRASAAQREGVTLRVDVELITVEVSVLDKKGTPVRNLSREDFQLFEDGKQQDIVTFAEIKEDSGQEVPTSLADIDESIPNRGKVVLIFFDDSHLTAGQVQIARDSAEKYVKAHMRPLDLFAVASYGMSLKILQNFTHDAAKVVEAIRKPALSFAAATRTMPGAAVGGAQTRGGASQRGRVPTSPENQETRFRSADLFRTLGALSSSVAQVRGRKIVLLFSEDFSAGTDFQTDFINTVNSAKKSNVSFYTIDARGLAAPQIISRIQVSPKDGSPGDSFRLRVVRLSSGIARPAAAGPFGSSLVPSAWASGMFQQGGGSQGGGQGGNRGGGGKPPGGGSSGGVGNPGGGRTPAPAPSNPAPGTGNTTRSSTTDNRNSNEQPVFSRFEQQRMENLLRSLASETGGVAIYNTGDFDGRLNEVNLELSNYYVLGFQSNNPKRDGRFRKLEVKVAVKGTEIRHRQGYTDPRPVDILAGSKGEKSLMAAMAAPAAPAQVPVTFRAVYFYESAGMARVPVTARIQAANMQLRKKSGQLTGDLNIMAIAYSDSGAVSSRFSETVHVSLNKEEEQKFRKDKLVYWNHFKLRPGKYQVKVAVSDEKGKVGSAEQSLEVPPLPQQDLAASSLVVTGRITRLPDLIQDMQAKLLDDSDPILYRGFQILPSIENEVPVNTPVGTVFKMYNLTADAQQRQLVAQVRLKGENGETREIGSIPIDENLFATGRTEGFIGLRLPFENIPAGKYRLAIAATEGVSKRTVMLETDLVFK